MTVEKITAEDLIAALDLPGDCRVDQRVNKKLLLEHATPNASDKRQIIDGIAQIDWLAALKPNTIGVPEYRDDVRDYLEIAVLCVTLKTDADVPAKPARLAELIHRAIPYPMLLLLKLDENSHEKAGQGTRQNSQQNLMLSMAHKRLALNEADKVILDGDVVAVTLFDAACTRAVKDDFLQALALRRQPQATLHALYQGWIDKLLALQAARLSGAFQLADSPEQAAARRAALRQCSDLQTRINSLRLAVGKEKQMARQVAINLEIKVLLAERAQAVASLQGKNESNRSESAPIPQEVAPIRHSDLSAQLLVDGKPMSPAVG
jgi:hypothetical protein